MGRLAHSAYMSVTANFGGSEVMLITGEPSARVFLSTTVYLLPSPEGFSANQPILLLRFNWRLQNENFIAGSETHVALSCSPFSGAYRRAKPGRPKLGWHCSWDRAGRYRRSGTQCKG